MSEPMLPDPHPSAPVTKGDLDTTINRHAHAEKVMAWIVGAVTSGVGALVTILGLVAVLVGAAWFILDRAEAAGAKPAQSVRVDLDEHKVAEAQWHVWTENMLYRQDQKSDAVLLGLGLRNPTPHSPPRPPPPDLPSDAGRGNP